MKISKPISKKHWIIRQKGGKNLQRQSDQEMFEKMFKQNVLNFFLRGGVFWGARGGGSGGGEKLKGADLEHKGKLINNYVLS